MTFEQMWGALSTKRDTLKDPEARIEFIVKNLKETLRQAYNVGARHERDKAENFRKIKKKSSKLREEMRKHGLGETFDDVFGGMFQ